MLSVAGWACVSDALEGLTRLTSLNGCDQYAAIRRGGLAKIDLAGTELGVWAARFVGRSESTLTHLDLRCAPKGAGLRLACTGPAPIVRAVRPWERAHGSGPGPGRVHAQWMREAVLGRGSRGSGPEL